MSDSAHDALMAFPEFITEGRGDISVKVKSCYCCFRLRLRAYGTACRPASPRRHHWQFSGSASNQNFSSDALARTVSDDFPLCFMFDSERVLFVVKCPCSPLDFMTL